LEENPQTDPIVIEENGLAEELFRDAKILQIVVDSGNQKWISVDGGVCFISHPMVIKQFIILLSLILHCPTTV
jgi:hypothetical protein